MTRLTSTDAFVDWMEVLYLSELVLLSARPAPKPPATGARKARAPATVTLELGLRDHEHEGARDRFRTWTVVASEIARWECDGALDTDHELTIARAPDVDAAIALRVNAGAVALLACGAVEVSEEGERFRKARPRPWQTDFTMWCSETTHNVGVLLDALGLTQPRLLSYDEPAIVAERAWSLASLRDRTPRAFCVREDRREICSVSPIFRHEPGWTLGIQRREGATDDEWTRAWALPTSLGARDVRSRTWSGDALAWSKLDWRDGAR